MASYKSLKSANAPAIPTGLIIPWSHNSIPNGFLVCGGQAVSRTTYADLFALIGTSYGAGDGSGTFNVPSLDGRQLLFDGTGSDGSATNNVGGTAGNATLALNNFVTLSGNVALTGSVNLNGNVAGHPLSTNELPSHKHHLYADSIGFSSSGTQTFINANEQATKGAGNIGQGPTDFKYTIKGVNSSANIGLSSATGNGSPHSHNHNLDLSNNQDANSNLSLSYPTIGSSDKLYQSTKLRALIKF